MRPCPQCGTSTPDAAGRCPACGAAIPAVLERTQAGFSLPLDQTQAGHTPPALDQTQPGHAAPALGQTLPLQPPSALGRTQTGHAAPDVAPPSAPRTPRLTGPAALKATVLGLTPSTPPPPPGAASTAPASPPKGHALKGTMIGMAPPSAFEPPAAPPGPALPPPKPLRGTMIGMAPPVPTNPTPNVPPPGTLPGPGSALAPELADMPVGKKTMLGIARPGIAPLNPGTEKPRVPSIPPPPAVPPVPPAVPLEPPVAQPWRPAPPSAPAELPAGMPRPLRIPAGAAVAIVGAAALLAAVGVAIFLYRERGAVEATLSTGADGHDRLALVCKGCADGASVRVGNARSAFRGGHAEVELEQKLAVGSNKIAAEIERRPGRADHVELSVPVDFRVRADTAGLMQAPPRLVVRVDAVPHAAVVVDGKPLALTAGAGGTETGAADIDVTRALTGASSVVGMLERKIPYAVTPPNGAPASGEVSVRIGVTPLVLQAPGASIVIESATFVLAGHTAKDATVSVEGRPITVDGTGAFAQMMSVSSLGETNITVRADAKDQAPRLVPVRVRRVQNLAAEATALRASATSAYSALERDPDAERGLAVALDGNVVEARADAFTTVLLFDVKSGCTHAPCLARVSLGEKTAFKEGTPLSVFGAVSGAVEGPHQGTHIPAIAADFVVKGHP